MDDLVFNFSKNPFDDDVPGRRPRRRLDPIRIRVSQADQDWIDEIRARSHQLAIQRGHIRR